VIPDSIRAEILKRLHTIEQDNGVSILYACESGSRAWGFASPDSDYDVRFIYAHPVDWYLSFDIETRRDVIELPIEDEIDCNGWDIRKTMYLFTRTNGALLEWLTSPIRYIERGNLRSRLAELAPKTANHVALCYHYNHMARHNAKEYLFSDQVKLKKYFYVLRPLLAIRYIEQKKQPPPIEFGKLVEAVAPKEIIPAIDKLLAIKQQLPESGLGAPIPEINHFIEAETRRHGETFKGQGRPDLEAGESARLELNTIFREILADL
jgi:predicted nucleotidyltransferase